MLLGIVLLADAPQEPDLVQPRAVTHLDGEGARADLGEERAAIPFLDRVETLLPVGDQPGEHVEAPGRAFRIGEGGDGRAQIELLDQRHEIDAAGFQHRALGQVDLVEFELGKLVAHRGVRPGQEARADAIGDLAEPEIEARGLDLVRHNFRRALISPARSGRGCAWLGRMPVRARAFTVEAGRAHATPLGKASNSLAHLAAPWICLGISRGSGHATSVFSPGFTSRCAMLLQMTPIEVDMVKATADAALEFVMLIGLSRPDRRRRLHRRRLLRQFRRAARAASPGRPGRCLPNGSQPITAASSCRHRSRWSGFLLGAVAWWQTGSSTS